jgi:hypothetical protein
MRGLNVGGVGREIKDERWHKELKDKTIKISYSQSKYIIRYA